MSNSITNMAKGVFYGEIQDKKKTKVVNELVNLVSGSSKAPKKISITDRMKGIK